MEENLKSSTSAILQRVAELLNVDISSLSPEAAIAKILKEVSTKQVLDAHKKACTEVMSTQRLTG